MKVGENLELLSDPLRSVARGVYLSKVETRQNGHIFIEGALTKN